MDPGEDNRLKSDELGLFLQAEGPMLRLIDAATGQPVLTKDERITQLEAQLEQERGRKGTIRNKGKKRK